MRDSITLEVDGLCLHGTCHFGPGLQKRGVLFFNSGAQPRSGRGDLNVRLAEAFSLQGYPCFRFDLPGLGDSEGDAPAYHRAFYQHVLNGGYGDCAAKLTRLLLQAHDLEDIVLLGLCGGAVTAVFAASVLKRAEVAGLVLLDLPFYSHLSLSTVQSGNNGGNGFLSKASRGAAWWKVKLRDYVLRRSWGPRVTTLYHQVKNGFHPINKNQLPEDTNPILLKTVTRLLRQDTPLLFFSPRPFIPQPPSYDYVEHLREINDGAIRHLEILGTTHSFVENGAPAIVEKAVIDWLSENAPRPMLPSKTASGNFDVLNRRTSPDPAPHRSL